MTDAGYQRLDAWLWCARMARARAECSRLISAGGIRLNRQPTNKPHAKLRVGDVLTLPWRGEIAVLRVLALGTRRGSSAQARLLYETVSPEDVGAPCTPPQSASYAPDRRPGVPE